MAVAHRRVRVRALSVALCAAFGSALLSGPALAGPFFITGSSTAAQTLGSGSGQTGTVDLGASLAVSGSTVAVTISGSSATLNNLGTISQTGTGRVVRDNTGVSNLVVNNGSATNATAQMTAADADVIQMNKSPASVTLNNYGTMTSLNASKGGAQVVDFNAIQSGANIVNNYATGVIQAVDADAVRPGVNGQVNNYGKIISTVTTDTGSDGVDAQNNSGVAILNDTGASITGARHGITGGQVNANTAFTVSLNNKGTVTGSNGSGLNIDGFNAKQTATIVNSGSIIGNGVTGDGDGVDVDGVVNITNTGVIRSTNAVAATGVAQSEGISVGGGSITNSGTIEGLVAPGNANAVGRGITLAGNDLPAGGREAIYAAATVTNQAGGTIRGQSDSAIYVDGAASGFTVTINNNAGGKIIGGGTANAAIRTGADNDTIYNAGLIDGSSSGKAISMGAGNNALFIQGGAAVVLGNIDGGVGGVNTMTLSPGAGNAFKYDGGISNFSRVEVTGGGTVTLTGQSTYVGVTVLSDGTLVLDGSNRLAAGSSLDLRGGTLELLHDAGVVGQVFAGLGLGADSRIDLHGSALTFGSLGSVLADAHLSVLDFLANGDLDFAFRFVGDLTQDAGFLALMHNTSVNGRWVGYRFDGAYTEVFDVPEPAAFVLVLQGLVLAGLVVRRRNKSGSAPKGPNAAV